VGTALRAFAHPTVLRLGRLCAIDIHPAEWERVMAAG